MLAESRVRANVCKINCEIEAKIAKILSKQNDLENIIRSQDKTINILKQENLMLKSKFESLEFLLFANPRLHGLPVSDAKLQSNDSSNNSDSPINSDKLTTLSTSDANKDQSVTLLNNPIIHCSDEGKDLYMPKGSKDYTLTGNSLIQKAPTKSSSSEIGSVPNMNNLEKNRSKDNPSKNNTPCPLILRRGWCIKGHRCDFSHQNLINGSRPHHMPRTPKSSVFCPFLRKKGLCLKGLRCNFSHTELPLRPFVKPPPTNGYITYPPIKQKILREASAWEI